MRAAAAILGALAGLLLGWPAVLVLFVVWMLLRWSERGRA